MFVVSDDIPEIPKFKTPEEHKKFCQQLIENGAIPKNKLKDKAKYYGACRNTAYAIWNADTQEFSYERNKFGIPYTDCVNHFEDDDGYDLFVPIKEV